MTESAYRPIRDDERLTRATVPSEAGPITEAGAQMPTGVTGVGLPFGSRTVTTASPVPRVVSTSSSSRPVLGNVWTVALSFLKSSGVEARSPCWMREPSWARTSEGMSLGVCVTKTTPTPLERMRRTVWTTWRSNSFVASANSRWASSKKNTSLGRSTSPTSGRVENRFANRNMMTALTRAGRDEMSPTPSSETTPRPAVSERTRSAVSKPGAPKNWPPPWDSSAVRARRTTPAVAFETPPIPASSSLPSSLVRNEITERRSGRSTSSSPWESAHAKISWRACSCVVLRASARASRIGPKSETWARTGTPGNCESAPPRLSSSTGKAAGAHSCPFAAVRDKSLSEPAPASARPVRSPLTSHRSTEEPAADSPSARSCRVRVLPVPVAPATRRWRLNMAVGIFAVVPGTRAPPSMRVPMVIVGASHE